MTSKQLKSIAWQPIETAPKDGTIVRLYAESPNRVVKVLMRWDAVMNRWVGTAFGVMGSMKTYWCPEHNLQPTHWMSPEATP